MEQPTFNKKTTTSSSMHSDGGRARHDLFQSTLLQIPDNVSAELLAYGQSKPDVISLAQGDVGLPTPDFICDAAYKAMQEGKTHYGPVLGQAPLRQGISDYYRDIFDVDVPSERVFVTSSGTASIHAALASIVEPEDEVICVTPIWRNIMGIVAMAGGTAVQVALDYTPEKGWDLDIEKIFAACTPKTKAILVVTPSNPTGWIMREEDMRAVFDFTRTRGIWMVADEVYGRFAYDVAKTPSFLEMAEPDDLLYVINSFSKAWAMTGWRLGWLIGPDISQKVVQDLILYENMGASTFSQYGALAALRDGEEFIESQKALWSENLDLFEEYMTPHDKVIFSRPQSTFYGFFKVEGQPDCIALCRDLIDRAGVSLAPGRSFGRDFEGWIRICCAVDKEILRKALERLSAAL